MIPPKPEIYTDTIQDKIANFMEVVLLYGGTATALYHMGWVFFLYQGAMQHYLHHLILGFFFAMWVPIITVIRSSKRGFSKWPYVSFLVATLIVGLVGILYIRVFVEKLENFFPYFDAIDIPFGYLVLIGVFIGTWIGWGPIMPILMAVFVAYFFFGYLIPPESIFGALTTIQYDTNYIMGYLGLAPSNGFIGWAIPLSANFMYLFVLFGQILLHTGVLVLFMEVGKACGNLFRAGPAYTAVVGSALVGTVTGMTVTNVLLVGNATIPTMKASGLKAENAAAIEAVASNGGQILPPVMSSTVFVMAEFINVSYIDIAIRAVLPALLYFVSAAIAIYFLVVSLGLHPKKEKVDWQLISRRAPVFVIPLALMVILLLERFSPMYAANIAIIATVLISLVFKETRPSLKGLLKGLSEGTVQGAQLAVMMACIGVISQVIITTGLGVKMGDFALSLTGGTLFPALLAATIVCIILGCGTPTTPAYIITAIACAPMLVKLGVPEMHANFFIFYFATISTLTPPVALGVMAAAQLAGADYFKSCWHALRIAGIAFVAPFAIVYHPGLLEALEIDMDGLLAVLSLLVISISYAIVGYGYFLGRVNVLGRIIWVGVCIPGLIYIFGGSISFLIIQLILFCVATGGYVIRFMKNRVIYEEAKVS